MKVGRMKSGKGSDDRPNRILVMDELKIGEFPLIVSDIPSVNIPNHQVQECIGYGRQNSQRWQAITLERREPREEAAV